MEGNDTTRLCSGDRHTEVRSDTFRTLFRDNYPLIYATAKTADESALCIFAVDLLTRRVAGYRALAPSHDGPEALVIGRHEQADLRLTATTDLSLRHAAIVCPPVVGTADLRYRMCDLRSRTGVFDEQARRVEALESEGFLFVRCSRFAIMVIPAAEVAYWPEDDAAEAWACIPERVYFAERTAGDPEQGRGRRRELHARARRRRPTSRRGITVVQSLSGLIALEDELLVDGESPCGALTLSAGSRRTVVRVGETALERGILLGRYDRCEAADLLVHDAVSRVHLLVMCLGDTLYAIDVGSTNGTYLEQRLIRITELTDNVGLQLAKIATVEWHDR